MAKRKTARERDEAIYSTPILASDTGARLDAIVRRHGGKPKAATLGRMVLPSPGRGDCEGQLDIFDDSADE